MINRLWGFANGGSPLRRHLAGAALGSLLLSLSLKGLVLLASAFLAHQLGAAGYGIYASAAALVVLLGVPTTLGLPVLVVRLVASYEAAGEWGLMRGLLQRANTGVLLLSMLLAVGGSVIVWVLGDRLTPQYAHTLWWAMAVLPLTTLGALRSAALRGLHHIVLGQLPENLLLPGLYVVLLVAWVVLGSFPRLTAESAMALRLIAAAVSFGVGAWLLLRRLPAQLHAAVPRYDMKGWIRAAGPLMFVGGMGIITSQTAILMLAAIKGPAPAGIFNAAARSADVIAFSLVVVNMAIQPTISRLFTIGEMHRLQRVVTIATRLALLVALPIALVFMLFGGPLLGLAFGSQFKQGATCLAILCVGQVVNAAAGSVGPILNMTGHERDAAIGMAVGAIINVVLNAALIPLYGIEGAAWATGLSMIAWNVALAVRVWKMLGLDSTALGFVRS